MYNFPIGIMCDSFNLSFKEAVERAASLGIQGLQIGVGTPEALDKEKIADMMAVIKGNGLCVSALCGDFGHGFGNPEKNPELIRRSKMVMDLAKLFETNIVTTHIGVVPKDKNHPRYKIMQEACKELADYADSIGGHFAVETGPEPATILKEFLDSLNSKGVAINLDPANLAMVIEDDPVQAVYTLKDYIVHTHAKDGIHLLDKDAEVIYGIKEDELANQGVAFQEVPLGMGAVDFPNYLKALDDIGYKGFLTIERECGTDPAADIGTAVNFLNNIKENA